jgi:LCP family protein required for cell wall assembly
MPARFDRSVRTPPAPPAPRNAASAGIPIPPAQRGLNGAPDGRNPNAAPNGHRASAAPAGVAQVEQRRRQIDAGLTRLTAAHAGMSRLAGISAPTKPGPSEPGTDDAGRPRRADPTHGVAEEDTEPASPSKLVRVGRVSAVALAIAVVLIAASGWGAKTRLNASIQPVAALDPGSESIINPAGQVGDENYLLIGSDPTAGGAEAQSGGAKSDAVMLVHVPTDRSRALLVSFPPDLEVTRPPCQRWDHATAGYTDELAPAEAQTRLGLAYAVGGPRCLTQVVQQVTGLSITRFVGLDFVGIRDMVNAVQGVQICTTKPVVDSVLGPIVPTPGRLEFSGDRALAFARAENVLSDASPDYGRIQRQQQLVSALIGKAMSNQVLLDPGRLQDFLAAFAAHTVSDRAGADELLTLARSLHAADGAALTVRTVPTTGAPNALGNEVLRESDTKALFGAVRDNKPFPPPPARDDAQPAQRDDGPGGSTLQVLNASERRGLADEVRTTLTRLGFTVGGIGNAAPAQRTVIRFTPDNAQQAERLATAVPAAVLTPEAAVPGGLQLVLGNGFDGVIRPPSAAGTTPGGTATCG